MKAYVLLGDTDGCLHTHFSPVGVVLTKEEAEAWVNENKDKYYRVAYSEVDCVGKGLTA